MDECWMGWRKVRCSCHCGGNEAYEAVWKTGPNEGTVSIMIGCVCHHSKPTMMEVISILNEHIRIDNRVIGLGRLIDVQA